MRLEYHKDIADVYDGLLASAYEKANIWPVAGACDGVDILGEEIDEAVEALKALDAYWMGIRTKGDGSKLSIPTAFESDEVKAYALATMFELLQVIAVCNKYKAVWETYEAPAIGGTDNDDMW